MSMDWESEAGIVSCEGGEEDSGVDCGSDEEDGSRVMISCSLSGSSAVSKDDSTAAVAVEESGRAELVGGGVGS